MRRLVHHLGVVAALAMPAAAHASVAQQVSQAIGTVKSETAVVRSDLTIEMAPVATAASADGDICEGHRGSGVMCGAGNGRRTRGGGEKASHIGWPAVTGILWIVRPAAEGKTDGGTDLNDELLGPHGNAVLSCVPRSDIL